MPSGSISPLRVDYGPYDRIESPTQTISVVAQQESSGQIWGKPARWSNIPCVKACRGSLPPGARGVKFVTTIAPYQDSHPTLVRWLGTTPGVSKAGNGFVSIPILVTKKHAGVMMIDVLDYKQVTETNFRPTAEIAMPVTWFKSWGMRFTYDTDDLDEYEIAAGYLQEHGLFAITHYVHASTDAAILMLPDAAEPSSLARSISALAEAFSLPSSAFRFRVNGEDASLTSPSQKSVAA